MKCVGSLGYSAHIKIRFCGLCGHWN